MALVESKRMRWASSGSTITNEERTYKVFPPGQDKDHPLASYKDPRLGLAQRLKDAIYKRFDLHSDSDDDETSDESERQDAVAEYINRGKHVIIHNSIGSPRRTRTAVPSNYKPFTEKEFDRKVKRSYKLNVKDEAKHLMERDCKCVELAIRFYNKEHDTDYEIVETLGSYRTLGIGFWYHCNFRAQCESDAHSLPKLFFAELSQTTPIVRVVNSCKMLDGPDPPETVLGCKFCGSYLLHPVNGFKVGSGEKDE